MSYPPGSKERTRRKRQGVRLASSSSPVSVEPASSSLHEQYGNHTLERGFDKTGDAKLLRMSRAASLMGLDGARWGNQAIKQSLGDVYSGEDDLYAHLTRSDADFEASAAPVATPTTGADTSLGHEVQPPGTQQEAAPAFEATFASGEHADIGDGADHGALIELHEELVSLGEINALGDYYASYDAIITDDAERFQVILRHLRLEMAVPGSVDTATWDLITDGEYSRLSEANESHFGESDSALLPESGASEATNGGTWEANYVEAFRFANMAASFRAQPGMDPETIVAHEQQARGLNAFGEHFLTDAFAAGHLFNKADYMVMVRARMDDVGRQRRNELFAIVADPVFGANTPLLSQYEYWAPRLDRWQNLDGADDLTRLIRLVDMARPDVLENACVLAAHNQLNSYEGGVPVETGNGISFNAPGDKTLASSPEAQLAAESALSEARGYLEQAMLAPGSDPEGAIAAVRQWIPRPVTGSGDQIVRSVLRDTSNVRGGMAAALTTVLSDEIDSVVGQLVDEEMLRMRPGVRPPETKPEVPAVGPSPDRIHTVVHGDWLSTIALAYYGDMMRYPEIYDANKDRIEGFTDPDRIEAGWELLIP